MKFLDLDDSETCGIPSVLWNLNLGAGFTNSVARQFYAGFRNFQWKENYRFVWIGMEQ